ncbi:MAG TPA: Xaa-Pro peptidase family protein, partial [Candidatus Methylomirabilis sp.]|nr:Xaa-Pro peptidase family protein [Candidatus Methylomirabilis sp.]
MALHFSEAELAERRRRACRDMAAQGLDGLLVFRQESMYYLTGYDTSGYSMFQGMYLGADGALALCTRSADLLQARLTSVIGDVRIWRDREGANPAHDLRDMLESHGCRGRRLGVEYHAYGLTAQRGKMVDAALDGFCRAEDASDLVRLLRLVKSPAELDYVRRAGQLADEALAVANRMTVPGAAIGGIYGEMLKVILDGDGDPSASRWPMGGGEEALLVRYHTGHGRVSDRDQVTFEFAASYRHYHAALMQVALAGAVDPRHRDMFAACAEALAEAEDALRPGRTAGEVFDAHARSLTKSGFEGQFLNACGYTLGATYPPTWMDWPMLYTGNPQVLAPGMVFFVHMILLDSRTGLSMSLGETSIVTETG